MPTPRKPTKLKLLEGNRGGRKLLQEPEPALGVARMPSGMPTAAQTLWRSIAAELDRIGLLSVVDGTALEAAVRAVVQARRADAEIEKLQQKIGRGQTAENDYYRLSIQNAVSRKAWQQWKSFATEFGLTPASRTRLAGLGDFTPTSGGTKAGAMDPIEAALCMNMTDYQN